MIAAALLALLSLRSSPELGKAEGRCRGGEAESAFIVDVIGLKDRRGRLKLELYPANDSDFLQDDNLLVAAGKAFRRVEIPVPPSGPVQLCLRAPGPGLYALSLLHDRDSNGKFGLSVDGIGFAGNPRLGLSKPRAAAASARIASGPTRIAIRLNYRKSFFTFAPLDR